MNKLSGLVSPPEEQQEFYFKPSTCACFLLFCLCICLLLASLLKQIFFFSKNYSPNYDIFVCFLWIVKMLNWLKHWCKYWLMDDDLRAELSS